jgi:hypothetical protein
MPQTIDDYRRHMHSCTAHAELSPNQELRELWHTIARSYRFLIEREERIEGENQRAFPP